MTIKKSESKRLTKPKNKPEAIKNIINREWDQKIRPRENSYFSWREKPISEGYLIKLCDDLLDWSRHYPDAYDLDEFYDDYGIWDRQVNTWAQKHEFLREAINQAKRIIGTRRHKEAFKRERSENIMLKTQHNYKPEWHKDVNEYHNEMRKSVAASGNVYILEKSIDPTSDEVPLLKEVDQ